MNPAVVYDMHDGIYHSFPLKNFKINLKNLIVAIDQKKEDAQRDEKALTNTLMQRPCIQQDQPFYPKWRNSDARNLLLMDIKDGLDKTMKPAELWQYRPEYKIFPLKTFRDHMNKEIKKPVIKAYWQSICEK